MKRKLQISNLMFSSLTILLLCFTALTSNAQAHIECASSITSRADDQQTVVKNGKTYIVTSAYGVTSGRYDQLFPVINGNSANGMYSPFYVAIFDENCNQTLGTYIDGVYGFEFDSYNTVTFLSVDDNGNMLIAGETASDIFPTTNGTVPYPDGPYLPDAVAFKIAPDGTLLFSTVIGGKFYEVGFELFEDANGNFYVFGYSESPNLVFSDGSSPISYAAFVYKYDASGNLINAKNLGERLWENGLPTDGTAVTMTANGFALSYETRSNTLTGTDGSTLIGSEAEYFALLDFNLNTTFSTIVNNSTNPGSASSGKVVSDNTGVYITSQGFVGLTTTDGSTYSGGTSDTYIKKYDYNGNLIFAKYLGSSSRDYGYDIVVKDGMVYILSLNASSGFPVVNGSPHVGGTDAYITKLNATNGSIVYSTAYGSSGNDDASQMFVDDTGAVYFLLEDDTGAQDATTTDGSKGRAVVVKLNPDGSLCLARATQFTNTGRSSSNNYRPEVIGDNFRIAFESFGGSTFDDEEVTVMNMKLCPTITVDNTHTISTDQSVCSNGVVSQLTGPEFKIDGSIYPQIQFRLDFNAKDQQDIELNYQWQSSSSAAGPWTDVPGALAQQKNYTPSPTTVTTYYRRLIKGNPCCGLGVLSTSNVIEILVDPNFAPIVDAGGQFYTTPGDAIAIGGNPTATGSTPFTYTWDQGAAAVANPSVAPTESTIYTVFVADVNGCEQADQATVTVYAANAGADKYSCSGGTVNLGTAPLNGVPIVPEGSPIANEYSMAYTWSPAAGLSCTDCPNPQATAPGNYTLTVTIYQPDGSSSTDSDTVVVTNANPPSVADFAGPDMVVCKGSTASLGLAPEKISNIVDAGTSINNITQSSVDGGNAATATNLTDGDFNTGALTADGGNIVIDLGSIQTFNNIELAILNDNDYWYYVEVSSNGTNYTRVKEISRFSSSRRLSLSNTELTSFAFDDVQAQYIRFRRRSGSYDVNISELRIYYGFRYQWSPGEFITSAQGSTTTFDAGNQVPSPDPYVYTLTATLGDCNFYDQVKVYVIEADAGEDGCGPRFIGTEDKTPLINETYSWVKLSSDPGATSDFLTVTNEPRVPVSANTTGNTTYELTTTFVLDGQTYTCTDTVIVPPCGCVVTIEEEYGNCPDFDSGNTRLVATGGGGDLNPEDFTYTWSPNVGLNAYNSREVVMTDNVERTYTVTATSILDPSYSCSQTIDVNLPAYAKPVFNVPPPVQTCSGSPVTIGDPASVANYSYSWSPTAGLDDATISNPTATVTEDTIYTVRVTDNVTGCYTEEIIEVELESLGSAGDNIAVCDNATVTLEGVINDPTYTYSWAPANASWQNGTDENTLQPNVFVATTTTFTLTITDPATGCSNTEDVVVRVSALPTPFTLPNQTVCPSDSVVLGWSNPDGTGTNLIPSGFDYSWSPAGYLNRDDRQNPEIAANTLTEPVTFTLTLYDEDVAGCEYIVTQTITPSSATPEVTPGTICLGEDITIGTANNATNGGTYLWSPAADLDSDTSPNPTFTPTSAGSFTFTATRTDGGCTTTEEVTIVVEELTVPTIAPVNVCQGQEVVIGPELTGNFTYEWFPATGLSDPNIAQPTFTGSASQNYTLTIVNTNGCSVEAPVTVTVSNTPPPTIELNDVSLCATTGSYQIDATVTGGSGNYAYFWDTSVALSNSSVEDPTFYNTGIASNTFSVTVIDQNSGCSTTEDITISFITCNTINGSIGDQLFVDTNEDGMYTTGVDTPITDVNVTLDPGTPGDPSDDVTVVTDTNGQYNFPDLPAENYTITVDTNDPDFPPGAQNTVDPDGSNDSTSMYNLSEGENDTNQDFGYIQRGSIGDTVWYDANSDGAQAGVTELGLEGATVTLDPGTPGNAADDVTTTTDANGNYLFDNLPAGNYTVTVDVSTVTAGLPAGVTVAELAQTFDADGTGTSNTSDYTLAAGEDNVDQDFGYQGLGSIGDRVWYDETFTGDQGAGEPGLEGATVTLDPGTPGDASDDVTSTTDANGNYLFDNLPAGNYTVTVDVSTVTGGLPAGVTPSDLYPTYDFDSVGTPNTSDYTLAAGDNFLDLDFGYKNIVIEDINATDNTAMVQEDTMLSDSGNVITDDDGNGVDSDNCNSSFAVTDVNGTTVNGTTSIAGTYGTLEINSDGSYTYNLDNANPTVQALNSGDTLTETFAYTVESGSFSTNSDFELVTGGTDTTTFNGTLPTDWTIGNATPDTVDPTITAGSMAYVASPTGGNFVHFASGRIAPAAEDAESIIYNLTGLTPGTTYTVSYDQTISNGSFPALPGLTFVDGYFETTVSGVTHSGSVQSVPALGTPAAWTSESFAFVATAATANLVIQSKISSAAAGDLFLHLGLDNVRVRCNSGTGSADLTVTIKGSDLVVTDNTAMVQEDTMLSDSGNVITDDDGNGVDSDNCNSSFAVTDVNGTTVNGTTSIAGTYGTLEINSDGSYTYNLDNANPTVQALNSGDTLTETFAYTVESGSFSTNSDFELVTGGTDTTTFNGTLPTDWTIGNATPDTVDPTITAGGMAYVASPTGGNFVHFASGRIAPAAEDAESIIYNLTGLTPGTTYTVSYDQTISNGSFPALPGLTFVDGYFETTVDGVTHTGSVQSVPALGVPGAWTSESFTFVATAATANLEIQAKISSAAAGDLFLHLGLDNVRVRCDLNTDSADLTVTIKGSDFNLTDNTAMVQEDTMLSDSGNVITDDDGNGVDSNSCNSTLIVTDVNGTPINGTTTIAGTYGTLDINSDGSYTYNLDNANPAVQALNSGDTLSELFTYTAETGSFSTNSDFELLAGGTDTTTFNGTLPTDWTIGNSTPDTVDPTITAGGMAYVASPTGGNFVHFASGRIAPAAEDGESIIYNLTGLTPGTTYTVSYDQTISNGNFPGFTFVDGFFETTVDGVTHTGSVQSVPALGVPGAWTSESFTFVATAATANLEIQAKISSAAAGDLFLHLGLDNVRVRCDLNTDSADLTVTIKGSDLGTIGDTVWYDTDEDGILDAGEPRLEGATVTLDPGTPGNPADDVTTTTDANGNYLFPNLPAGDYVVTVDVSTVTSGVPVGGTVADLVQIFDADGLGSPSKSYVQLAAGENNLDQDFAYVIPSGGVGGGHGGGVESESLGDAISKIYVGRKKNSEPTNFIKDNSNLYNKSKMKSAQPYQGKGQTLLDMFPTQLYAGNVANVTSPTDILDYTVADEVLSVDFSMDGKTKGVVLGIKTTDKVYNHTKASCDRLRGAEILNVQTIQIEGYNFLMQGIKQRNGEVEYAVSFATAKNNNDANYTIQTNWYVNNYTKFNDVYNFQVWSTKPADTKKLVTDVLKNLQSFIPVKQVEVQKFPETYASKIFREKGELIVQLRSTEVGKTAEVSMVELYSETANNIKHRNNTVTTEIQQALRLDIADGYEYDALVKVNGEVKDAFYHADGNWGLDYDKRYTEINKYFVWNDFDREYQDEEYTINRNVEIKATSDYDYLTVYKSLLPGTISADYSAYNYVAFTAKGSGLMELGLVKSSIEDWKAQYRVMVDLSAEEQTYYVPFDIFSSSATQEKMTAEDLTTLLFTFLPVEAQTTELDLQISNVRFTKTAVEDQIVNKIEKFENEFMAYPNPSKGNVNLLLFSETDTEATVTLSDITGKIIYRGKATLNAGKNELDFNFRVKTGVMLLQVTSPETDYGTKKLIFR